MSSVQDIISKINGMAPFEMAEKWDNSGLQVGNPYTGVEKAMIALDVTLDLVETAVREHANVIITHHPLLISPSKRIDFSDICGRIVYLCARHDISVISAHTNLDKAEAGLNDYFAEKLGLTITHKTLSPPETELTEPQTPGIGRIGTLDRELELRQFIKSIKKILGISHLRVTGDVDKIVQSVAVCTGSGGSLVDDFINSGADVFVTGDVKYHEARIAEQNSKAIVDVGHFASEHIAIDLLYEQLSPVFKSAGVDFMKYQKEKDPFTIV